MATTLSYDDYANKYYARLCAEYELGQFAENMDFDVYCLEAYNDFMATVQ